MAIPSTGTISLTTIQTEFGGTNPIGLSEYYAGAGASTGGGNTPGGAGGSGIAAIRFANTYDNLTSTTGSPTFVNTGGYYYYYFNSNGSFTV